ncbi:MAG: SHOCT domain-containing protein [Actinomycetota bacterium]
MPDSTEDRRQRHYELLKKSRDALSAEQAAEAAPPPESDEPPIPPAEDRREGDRRQGGRRKDDLGTYMYRGREVKRGLGSAPGAGSGAAKTNWEQSNEDREDKTEAIRKALAKLSQLHAEGKVSDEDYEEKKQKLLSRL